MLIERLRAAALEGGGWTVEESPRDEDGNVTLIFIRSPGPRKRKERVNVSVFFDEIKAIRPTGQLMFAMDEHGALLGTRATLHRLRQKRCIFCGGNEQ